MGTVSSFSPNKWVVDQIVASVGPYKFQTEQPHLCNSNARVGDKASPPQSIFNFCIFKFLLPLHPASNSIPHVDGVACIIVTFSVSNLFNN